MVGAQLIILFMNFNGCPYITLMSRGIYVHCSSSMIVEQT